uniref:Uncharacterized protein n=1 Tax=Tanacetum cinerariifolium TaxID=118510 RepID=A0A699J9C9_TANCI|nr:hypothetical protein [Tanacetum cinerariifolium]
MSIVTKENRAACILDNHAEGEKRPVPPSTITTLIDRPALRPAGIICYSAAKRIEVENSRVNVVTRPVFAPPAAVAVAPAKPMSFIANLYLQI